MLTRTPPNLRPSSLRKAWPPTGPETPYEQSPECYTSKSPTLPRIPVMSPAPWKIYAEQLAHVGFGYPLWVPDPSPGSSPIEIGDVGWVRRGEFIPLFNAFRAASDRQPFKAVPAGYEQLDRSQLVIRGPRETIRQEILHSRNIQQLDVSGGVAAGGPLSLQASAGLDFRFQCRDDVGALLKLNPPSAKSCEILSEAHIAQYVHRNLDSWLDFANGKLGIGLKERDIRFVCGTTMAVRWTVAAFHGSYRNKKGMLSGALGVIPGSAHVAVAISDRCLPPKFYRVGPPERLGLTVGDATVLADSAKAAFPRKKKGKAKETSQIATEVHDQCIFIYSFKRKTLLDKLRPLRLRGSGRNNKPFVGLKLPKDIPKHKVEGGGTGSLTGFFRKVRQQPLQGSEQPVPRSSVLVSEEPPTFDDDNDSDTSESDDSETADVLDDLLDYILERSDATTAVASDVELYRLLGDMPEWPGKLDEALLQRIADIRVDDKGVGTLYFHDERRGFSRIQHSGQDEPHSTQSSPKDTITGDASIIP
ncbi:hypothetical protein BD414DRAFT_533935 [Trametes punicea]|nr:hypothetical protein BD414DRAFT_533935 [Trametes punicea]